MSEREIIKIAVTPSAKASIEQTSQRYGMSQIALASRMYEWFAVQDEVVQAAILDLLPREVAPDVSRLILQRMAETAPSVPRAKAAKKASAAVRVTKKLPKD